MNYYKLKWIFSPKSKWTGSMLWLAPFFRYKQTSASHKLSRLSCTVEYWLELQSLLWNCGSLGNVISERFCSCYSGLLFQSERPVCVCVQTSGWYSVALCYFLSTMVMGFGKTWQSLFLSCEQERYDRLSEMHMVMIISFTRLIEACGLGWIIDTKCTKLLRPWVALGRLELG